ncbi:sensor histidine kinase, partial [Lutimonas sp.]|uniref:sensor histidine kinase n=1 Tax=Lutimonas sp. TaxID=1872403 RepID=UPI003C7893B7
MHTINTGLMKDFLSKGNQFLIDYLYLEGDSQETLMQKKIWWILTMAGLPFLIVMSLVISDKMGIEVVIINTIFALAMIVSLLIFHFQRNNIERHALFIEITILSLTVIKVYLMGGLLEAGGAIFIGMISPLYALTTPNRKRAIFLYLIYLAGMIAATELQPDIVHNYFLFYYYMGFALGITMAFSGLYYYTGELERLKQNEKLRMEELDQLKNNFYTHITHEFRTPLTIILGMADQIREDRERNLDQGLEMITRNGKKLLNMTNQLLDLSKMEAMLMPVHWVQQDIIGYLKYLVESFHSFAEASHIDLSYSIDEDSLVMDFDPDKINDILTNLISNAIKFTPEGGKVRVKAFREEINGENRLQLLVIDNGPGIAKAYLPRVFERYFQAKRHEDEYTEGSGLGLAITRELVFLMKGNISVSSELNEGTTFSVTIPISNQAKREAVIYPTKTSSVRLGNTGSEMESFAPEHKGKLKLLIVEDSKDVAAYLNSLLSLKYEISNAWN